MPTLFDEQIAQVLSIVRQKPLICHDAPFRRYGGHGFCEAGLFFFDLDQVLQPADFLANEIHGRSRAKGH